MRFRATIQNVPTFYREQAQFDVLYVYRDVFVGLIQTVEKLQKKCIIKFSEAAMRIICNQEEGGVHVWSYVVIPSFTLLFL
jgi:HUS1 checkpoint protein